LAHSILGASVQFGKGSAFIKGLADLIRSPAPVTSSMAHPPEIQGGGGPIRFPRDALLRSTHTIPEKYAGARGGRVGVHCTPTGSPYASAA
ncbi:MAG TPA: hypothetical protein VKC57_12470, partial [Ktedonobacterales bacterium]|nr:hypothetical protein [Ktedonobacterales bacterium]